MIITTGSFLHSIPAFFNCNEIHLWVFLCRVTLNVITVTLNNYYGHPITLQCYNEVKTCVCINTAWV